MFGHGVDETTTEQRGNSQRTSRPFRSGDEHVIARAADSQTKGERIESAPRIAGPTGRPEAVAGSNAS